MATGEILFMTLALGELTDHAYVIWCEVPQVEMEVANVVGQVIPRLIFWASSRYL